MSEAGYALFETAIGLCAIAWGPAGVTGAQLPEGSAARARARLVRRFPDLSEAEPPPAVRRAIDDIVAHIGGEAHDLRDIVLDLTGVPAFHVKVYDVARAILPGETLTYGEVARRVGEPGGAQAVGQALGRNPFPIIVPCHRVLAAGGRTGGFSADGGVETKFRLLTIEKARTSTEPTLFDGDSAFAFVAPPRARTRTGRS